MKISFITPFSELLQQFCATSILKRAEHKKIVEYSFYNLFSFSDDSNSSIDDHPYGGGDGMVMTAQPIFSAFNEIVKNSVVKPRVVYPTPDGNKLNTNIAESFVNEEHIIFICGHYKGIDQRVRDEIVTDEISIGDYILTGGEVPACVILDSIVRLVPGVLNSIELAKTDSFYDGLLDSPHYTRPEKYDNLSVPDVLVSGNHKKIEEWKMNQRIKKTKTRRPDLYEKYIKSKIKR